MRPLINVTSLLSLNAVLESSTATNLPPKPVLSLYTPRIPLNDTVYTQVRKLMLNRPSITFRELQVTSTLGPTTNPELLADVRLLFSDPHGTLYSDMTTVWGTWGSLRVSQRPYPGGYNPLPPRLGMDIVFADELIKRAGYSGPYQAVDVKWPSGLRFGKDQPYYCFLMEGNKPDFVYVGVNDQTVVTSLHEMEQTSNISDER